MCILGFLYLAPANATVTGDLRADVARVEAGDDAPQERIELGLACLERLAQEPDPELEGKVRLALGVSLTALERFENAWEHLDAGARLARETEDDRLLAHCCWLEAIAAFNLGRLGAAVGAGNEGLDAAERAAWDAALWRIANVLGLVHQRRGDSAAALEVFGRGLEVAERVALESGDSEGVRVLLGNVGITYMNLGELAQAHEIFERVEQETRDAPGQEGLASALANVGDVLIMLGELDEAEEHHRQALALREQQGSEVELALSHHSLGAIRLGFEQYEDALRELEIALEIRRRLGLEPEVAATLAMMSQAYAGLDREEDARESALHGLELTERLELKGRRAAIMDALAVTYERLGDHESAIESLRKATELERKERSLETRKALAEFRAEFETKEKEQRIELLSREKELQDLALSKRRFERNALVVGVLFVSLAALAGWLAFASLRRATKRIRKLEQERVRVDKLESIGVLAGGIAHDFNNILAAAVGNLSLLALDLAGDARTRELLDDASQALDQGKELSTQLLAFARGGHLEREVQELEPVLRQATALALVGAATRAEFSIAPGLWPANIDPVQLRQLFTNLVLNADQAMPGGGVVEISAENVVVQPGEWSDVPAGPALRITVVDHGAGIDPEIREKVFDPYFTTKEEGSGLGLALAYGIVRHHEGAIRCSAEPDGGTCFEVVIPAAPTGPAKVSSPDAPIRAGAGRVLVMDDEPLIRKLYRASLTRLGYECETVEDGDAAVRAYERARSESAPFDVVVLDLTIPGGRGGWETMRELRELDPGVRAIVASGYSADSCLVDALEAGFCGVLSKPFTLAALSQALEQAMRSKALVEA